LGFTLIRSRTDKVHYVFDYGILPIIEDIKSLFGYRLLLKTENIVTK